MIACPYVLSIRNFADIPWGLEPNRWIMKRDYPDVIKAREAARQLRRFWPHLSVRITYPPVGD